MNSASLSLHLKWSGNGPASRTGESSEDNDFGL